MASAERQETPKGVSEDSTWSSAPKLSSKVRELAHRSFHALKANPQPATHIQRQSIEVVQDLRDLRDQIARLHAKSTIETSALWSPGLTHSGNRSKIVSATKARRAINNDPRPACALAEITDEKGSRGAHSDNHHVAPAPGDPHGRNPVHLRVPVRPVLEFAAGRWLWQIELMAVPPSEAREARHTRRTAGVCSPR